MLVGFAAETTDVIGYASRKREAKRVDLIVANDVGQPGAGFEVETNIASFVTADGVQSFPLEAKTALAARIVAFIAERLACDGTAITGAGSPPDDGGALQAKAASSAPIGAGSPSPANAQ